MYAQKREKCYFSRIFSTFGSYDNPTIKLANYPLYKMEIFPKNFQMITL